MSIFETDLDSQMKDFVKRAEDGHSVVILVTYGKYIDVIEMDKNGREYYGEGVQDEKATDDDVKEYLEKANIPYKIEMSD